MAVGSDGANTSAAAWAGDASGGTRTYLASMVDAAVEVTLSGGQLSLYTFDWVVGDNAPTAVSTVRVSGPCAP